MNKLLGIRIMFFGLGIACLIVLYFTFLLGYVFGPLAFNPPEVKPHFIVDMFFYKEYFVIGLIHLSSLIAAIMSFVVAIKPDKPLVHHTLLCYLVVLIALLLQVAWSSVQRGGTLPQLKEGERALQEQEKIRKAR